MIYLSYIFSIMSEVVFVLGALSIWSGALYSIIAIFSIIGIAKYFTASKLLHIEGVNKTLPIAILGVLTTVSFIMHLAFFTNLSMDIKGKTEIASKHISSISNKEALYQEQKEQANQRIQDIESSINNLPANYITKRKELKEASKEELSRLYKTVEELNKKLLDIQDSLLGFEVDSTNLIQTSSNNLKPLEIILGINQDKILTMLNIIIAMTIDIFALYFAYSSSYRKNPDEASKESLDTVLNSPEPETKYIVNNKVIFGELSLDNFKTKKMRLKSSGEDINYNMLKDKSVDEIKQIGSNLNGKALDWIKCAVIDMSIEPGQVVSEEFINEVLDRYGLIRN